ncbi:MAG: hypothetical protein ABJ327_24530 [Litoreibacter sp.]
MNGMATQIDPDCRTLGYPSDLIRFGWFGTQNFKHSEVAQIADMAFQLALDVALPSVPVSLPSIKPQEM